MIIVQFAVIGLGIGALYALIAQGLVVIYRGSGIVNFGQGAIGMIGAFLCYELFNQGWPKLPSVLVGIGVSVALAMLTQAMVIRRLRRASSLVRLVSTLAVLFFLVAVGNVVWGTVGEPATSFLPIDPVELWTPEVVVPSARIWMLVIAVVVTALLWSISRFTTLGRSTEAVAENPIAAAAVGLSPDRVAMVSWVFGGALAGGTAILLSPVLTLSVTALAFVVFKGLAAALVGGFKSYWWTLVGALFIGVAEAELSYWQPARPGIAASAPFVVIIIVLVVAGRSLPLRGELMDRLPRLSSGIVRLPLLLVALAISVALTLTNADNAVGIQTSAAFAVVCLSVVVVTGLIGQLTLGQMALAGFGAWIAGRLTATQNFPFPLAMLTGMAATIVLALLFAIPAVRTRGINLAIITFGLAIVVFRLILNDATLTGGIYGTPLNDPHIGPIGINPVTHPENYAYLCLAILLAASLMVASLRRSPTGRRMIAVRNNERGAAALGINVAAMKLFAFGVAGGIAAAGGVLLVYRQNIATFSPFAEFASVQVVVFTVIGGVGYIGGAIIGGLFAPGGIGAVLGAHIFTGEWLNVLAGVILVANLIVRPDGSAAYFSQRAERRREKKGARRAALTLDSVKVSAPEEEVAAPSSLRVESLTVRFEGVVAVDDVSCEVVPGVVLGVIGPNGAGKTTLIDVVTGFTRPTTGTIYLDGTDITRLSPHRRARLGIGRAFQSLELFDDLTILENIAVACQPSSLGRMLRDLVVPKPLELTPRAVEAIRTFGLEEVLNSLPEHVSYAHRRLVAIVRAIAAGSSVILLDEPAAGLSKEERHQLGQIIRRLADEWGLAVLLVEHDVDLVTSVSDQILALDFGAMVCTGNPGDVLADPAVRASYLGIQPENVA